MKKDSGKTRRKKKGEKGYLASQKKVASLRTAFLFGISLAIYLTGYFSTGSNENLLTIVAVLAPGFIGLIIYLLVRRVIRPHIPVTIILTVAVMSGIFWLIDPGQYTDPLFNILTGGLLLGSIFMATDYVTSPMATKGMVIYGIGIGVLTVLIRYFGSYPEGVSFAILIMNSIVPLLNKYIKPARFGKEVKHA